MKKRSYYWIDVLLTASLMCLFSVGPICAKDKEIDICGLVSKKQLAGIYRKPLFPTAQRSSCFWSEEPGAMAYLQISFQQKDKELRNHFFKDIPAHELVEIKDLGDGGLIGITKGQLELIVIQKKNMILKSYVNFLNIEQGSKEQENLWEIYRTLLREM